MSNKTIADFETYLSEFQVKSIRLTRIENRLQITCSLFTFKVTTDLALFAAVSLGFYLMPDRNSDLVFAGIMYAVVLGILWADFNAINIVTIDLIDKRIQITSRNMFKRAISGLFPQSENQFAFADISSFTVRSNESFNSSLIKYFIDLNSAGKTTKVLLNFSKEGEAHTTAKFLADVTHC